MLPSTDIKNILEMGINIAKVLSREEGIRGLHSAVLL